MRTVNIGVAGIAEGQARLNTAFHGEPQGWAGLPEPSGPHSITAAFMITTMKARPAPSLMQRTVWGRSQR
ncbi:hypothetical protein MPEAHAMD_3011 [Methylobacterium frigidaeris]|uniref:Uncharacterized protein n=1 Tax=Methylobacterium frigidaeris TaxID=2038277 RepID=A0AA37HBQ4_9HYPH|nr:hypothetical protein MPEAHAMD_3011 [Methylobacterium frigidaeris]